MFSVSVATFEEKSYLTQQELPFQLHLCCLRQQLV